MTLAPFHMPDPITITVDLPFPPSTNGIWRKSVRGVHLSKDYKDWINRADMHLIATRTYPKGKTIIGPCEVHILLNIESARRGSDADNRIKAVLDYAQRIKLVDNDSLIMRGTWEWARPSAAPAGCRLTLRELAG